jgi:hypothetical protein
LRYCELHLMHRAEFGFGPDSQQRVPIHVHISSPVLARALGVTAQSRTDAAVGWHTSRTLSGASARTLNGEQPPWTYV